MQELLDEAEQAGCGAVHGVREKILMVVLIVCCVRELNRNFRLEA